MKQAALRCRLVLGAVLFVLGTLAQAAPRAVGEVPDLYRDAMLAITEGRLADAEQALASLLAGEPRHAGAWLDLAMLYCAAGNAATAETLFTEIESRFAPPPPILDVITQQRQLGCSGWQAKNHVMLRLGRGFQSNVNQGAPHTNLSIGSGDSLIELVLLPAYWPHSDQFTNLSVELVRDLSPSGATGLLQFQNRTYDHLSGYNTSSFVVGAEQPWRWGSWGLKATGSIGAMSLDGQLYLKQTQLQLALEPPLPLPANWQLGVAAGWNKVSYATLSSFDAQWWETRGTLSYRKGDLWLQSSLSAVQDQQNGHRAGGDRAGTLASLQGRLGLGGQVVVELGWHLQRWQGALDYFPGLIDVRRQQNTRTLRAAAIYPLNGQSTLVLEWKNTENDENISVFAYRDRVLQLSWQWQR